MRGWLLPPVLALLVSGCADVGDTALPVPSPSTQAVCRPAPDPLAFEITYRLHPAGRKLQRPFMVVEGGRVFVAANTHEANGTLRKKGAVWIAKDEKGDQLSALNDIARAESD